MVEKENREVEIAKTISKRLNIPWFFIPYTNRKLKKLLKDMSIKTMKGMLIA